MSLTDEQSERYVRQVLLPEIGVQGQEKLLAGRVLLVGAGGLGSAAAFYLTAAGVGTIGLIDSDRVELSNLQRQILHSTADLGRPKVESAAGKMRALNPGVRVNPHHLRLTAANALDVLRDYDFIIDSTDNFPAKFLIADACHFAGKPYSHAGILRLEGQTMTVKPGVSACYRCVFNALPPALTGPSAVLGVSPGVMGTLQAAEAIKYLLGQGTMLTDSLLVYNALNATFRKVGLKKNPRCPLCGATPSITELKDESWPAAPAVGR